MSETLRALLHRHADELADKLAEFSQEQAATEPKSKPRRQRITKPLVAPPEIPIDDVTKAYAQKFLRKAGLG